MVAPSDMMDGRILKIRKCLDGQGYAQTGIISYSAKFSSSYYGPFRDAIDSKAEVAVDKSGYQLNPANFREAQRELELDHLEGAGVLMVKPAEPYLSVIRHAKTLTTYPLPPIKSQASIREFGPLTYKGWLDLEKCAMESLLSIKRAGADIIFTYFAERASRLV